MGASYYICGSFPVKESLGPVELEDAVSKILTVHCDQEQFELDYSGDTPQVTFKLGDYMSHGSITRLDEELIELFKALVDFTVGVATYEYEYEDERTVSFWGPEAMCLDAYIEAARCRLRAAEAQIKWAKDRLKTAKRKKVELVDNFVPGQPNPE